MDDQLFKKDQGKPPLALIPFCVLVEIAHVLRFGATKYAVNAWRDNAGEWMRLLSATQRHLGAWSEGEDRDPETGLLHLAHAACCVIFLIYYALKGLGIDDRYRATS